MPDQPNQNMLVNLGDIAKPASILIKRICDAVGCIFEPTNIVRKARAETEASKIRALGEIEITDIHQRAIHRLIAEEARFQENIESIVRQALPGLQAGARPDDVLRSSMRRVAFARSC